MRTRFLTTDYFTTNQTVAFLRLPLSPLPSSHDPLSFFDDLLPCCTDYSSISVTLQLDNLPIDDALFKFYADVLPQTIDIQIPEKEDDLCYEKKAAQSCLASDSETLENQFAGERHKDTVGDKYENEAIIQFETPELTQHLEYVHMLEKEEVQLFPEVQNCDDSLEMLNLMPTDLSGFDIIDHVCSVEAMHLECDMTLKSQISDEAVLLQNDIPPSATVLPLLEVEEIELSDFTCLCLEDECGALFDTIEGHHSASSIDLELCCQDLLVSMEIDILEHISDSHSSKLPLEFYFPSLNLALDIDLLQVIETRYSEKNTGLVDASPIQFADIFLFEEFMMLDSEPFDIFEVHAICQKTEENELCNMFDEDIPSKSFDELIVSCELAMIDGTFKSLSVPDLVDDEKIWSLHVIVDNILTELEPVPLSTSDEIYLDWHLLGKEKCNGDVDAAIEKVFSDIEDYTMGFGSNFDDGSMLLFDFLLSDSPSVILNIGESKVTMPSGASCTAEVQNNKVVSIEITDEDCQTIEKIRDLTDDDFEKLASGKLLDDDCQIIEKDEICNVDYHKLVAPVESLPQFNDLDFFLNPKKATDGVRTGKKINPREAKSTPSKGPQTATSPSSSIQMQQFGFQLHTLILPANINVLIDNLRRSYLAIFRNDIEQSKIEFLVTNSNDMNLLKLSEEKLMDQGSRLSQQKSFTGHVDDNVLDFVTLCAIKRMTWCLCFCGVYSLHQFLCKLFQSLDSLKPRLSFLYSLIEDAYQVVDKEVTKSHPSLDTIKKLLLQKNNNRRGRVLIIAQQVLWEPLKRLLTSMDMSFSEVDPSMHDNQSDLDYDYLVSGTSNHIQTTCLLAPYEHVSSSILLQNFDIIVEYGGPCSFSKVSTHYPEYIGPQTLHFLKVELDDVAKAMCEGVIVTSDDRDTVNLEAVLNFGPIKEKCNELSSEASDGTSSCGIPIPKCHMAQNSEQFHPCDLSFQDLPIIINTQNFDKEMIISRRITYQKILAMEKRGVQVVERDLILPVDMILDSTTCILWYDCKNIVRKATVQSEDASKAPLCIEHIAANVLTSLSFAFTTCILIFEGDCNFLGSVMESADEIYAAAASLGTYLQVFYSSSSELTDEIILNYIGHFRKRYKGLLSRLPDSETLAESFLSKFPSINPLSAHAIISSGSMLLEFFEKKVEGRVHTLGKYHASDESVNLFSALCKYGEREESKSGVTDCSSSVSSPPDSGDFVYKINSDDRKRKYVASSCDVDFRCSRPSKKYVDNGLVDEGLFRSSDPEVSKGPRINLQKKLPDFLLDNELFFEGDVPDTAINMDPSNGRCETNINGVPKGPVMEDDFDRSTLHVNDGFPIQQKSGRKIKAKREESARNILKDLNKDFVDEVVDFYDKSLFDGELQRDEIFLKPSPMVSENVKFPAPRYNRTARRLSFGDGSDQNIPMADAVDTSFMLEDDRQLRADNDFNGVEYRWSNNSCKGLEQEEQKGRSILEKSMKNFSGPFSKGKHVPSCGETPLSKAVQSTQLQQGSPWTIEFLNRIKEKRKLRQQCQPYASLPRTGYHGSITKATKRRSPSILEYYKYQSDNKPKNVAGQKMQKQHAQLRNERPSGFRPICTPIDKRARRSLSFATNGTGNQTKLVWGANISCSQDSGFSG